MNEVHEHTISLSTAYGEVLASEEVDSADWPRVLRRFYNQAMEHQSSVVVLDGIAHTRNAFLEFVREYNDRVEREERLHLH